MSACTNTVQYPHINGKCEFSDIKGCDRSCYADSDCKEICGAGCININQQFDPKGTELLCTPLTGCSCMNNVCQKTLE